MHRRSWACRPPSAGHGDRRRLISTNTARRYERRDGGSSTRLRIRSTGYQVPSTSHPVPVVVGPVAPNDPGRHTNVATILMPSTAKIPLSRPRERGYSILVKATESVSHAPEPALLEGDDADQQVI